MVTLVRLLPAWRRAMQPAGSPRHGVVRTLGISIPKLAGPLGLHWRSLPAFGYSRYTEVASAAGASQAASSQGQPDGRI